MSEVLVSVVIPCSNATYLGKTLASLAEQVDPPPFEIVIVDDTDDDLADMGPMPEGPCVRIVRPSEHGWAGANRNVGVAAARGHHMLFVDADDAVRPDYVRAMSAALDDSPLVCARISLGRFHADHRQASHQQEGPIVDDLGFLPYAQGGTLGVRRDVFDRVQGFDPTLRWFEEADLCWRVQLAGHPPPLLVADAVLEYRMKTSAWAIARKAFQFGRCQVGLHERFRVHGMPGRTLRTTVTEWREIVRLLGRRLARRPGSSGLLHALGFALGRIVGSVEHRRMHL